MRRLVMIISLLSMLCSLSGIELRHHDGRSWRLNTSELQQSKLLGFETVRDKDGTQLKEKWQGIELLPWLRSLAGDKWHSMRLATNDGYVLNFSRLELKSNTAYLALKQDGRQLSDYDIRIIVPSFRESKWPRNLKSIQLEDFKPMLAPRQIYVWDNWFDTLKMQGNMGDRSVSMETLMREAFVQEAAEVLLVDKQMQSIRLRYPDDLVGCSIIAKQDNKLHLTAESSAANKLKAFDQMGEIIYLQCGPIAFIRKTALKDITELGENLAWDWKELELREYKQNSKKYKGGKMKAGSWLELK